ncbi:MAG TPA: hypothetical protein VFI47_15895 [Acidimicrobiales bacterium]|nr:hypothetical protein [Acidimicrobiales bacterium]
MLTHRLQVLLDEDRWQRLEREAGRRGVAVAVIVREAIDEVLAPDRADDRRAAAHRILQAPPMDVPADPTDLKREIADTRSRWS